MRNNDYYAVKCSCGAITVFYNGSDESWSMPKSIFKERFPDVPIARKQKFSSCNYCVNNWGVDLCACGSGEKYNKCNNGYHECGEPMQTIGVIKERVLWRM